MRCATGKSFLNETDSATKSYTKAWLSRQVIEQNPSLSNDSEKLDKFRVKYIAETAHSF